jgi:hypothetical protein
MTIRSRKAVLRESYRRGPMREAHESNCLRECDFWPHSRD